MHSRTETVASLVARSLSKVDCSWLKTGDTVFVKVACNSANVHPAVTSPDALVALVNELYKRGAKRVIVGDQGGVQNVRLAKGNKRFSATRELMKKNGLLAAIADSKAEAHFFDEQDYETGYVQGTPTFTNSHWKKGLYVPRILKEVDHLVYLTRLSSHVIAGYTHGHKCAMGFLRDDSRFHVHHDAASLHEKFVEINYVAEIRERHRLTMSFADSILLDSGPDDGTVGDIGARVLVASRHLANHDAVATQMLAYADGAIAKDPSVAVVYGPQANAVNRALVQLVVPNQTKIVWGDESMSTYTTLETHAYQSGINADRALRRAYEILGGVPKGIAVNAYGDALSANVRTHLSKTEIFEVAVT